MALDTANYTPAFSLLAINGAMAEFFVVPLSLLRIQKKSTRLASLTSARSLGTVLARLVLVVGLRMGVVGIMLADGVVTVVLLVVLSGVTRSAMAGVCPG